MERVDRILELATGPKVLDIGCTDHNIKTEKSEWLYGKLVQKFPDLVGIDIQEENLSALRAMGYKNLFCQSAEDFDLPDLYDSIVAGELIEHLSNPGLFLSRAMRHLKPGGKLIITTPNPFCIFFGLYALFKYPTTCPNAEHTCWFCPSTFRELYSRYGFREQHFEYINDYELTSSSFPFQVFLLLIRVFRFFMPKRLWENRMIFVLAKD